MPRSWSLLRAAPLVLGWLATTHLAYGEDSKAACVATAEHMQQLREEHRLVQARAEAITCMREECPDIIRKDCADALQWLAGAMPSIVVRAKDARGSDRADVRVVVDKVQVRAQLDGAPIVIDPGVHTLRLEAPGATPWQQELVVAEGERNRMIEVVLASTPVTTAPVTPVTTPTPASGGVRIPPAAWVAGGVGVLGIAGFAYFGLRASSEIDSLRSSCAPYCTEDEISNVQSKRIAADVLLGVGLVGLGVATYLVIRHSNEPQPAAPRASVSFDAQAVAGGGMATARGRF